MRKFIKEFIKNLDLPGQDSFALFFILFAIVWIFNMGFIGMIIATVLFYKVIKAINY